MLKKVSLEVLAALTTRTDSTSSVQVAASVHGDSAESVEAAVMELKDRLGRNVEAAENILHSYTAKLAQGSSGSGSGSSRGVVDDGEAGSIDGAVDGVAGVVAAAPYVSSGAQVSVSSIPRQPTTISSSPPVTVQAEPTTETTTVVDASVAWRWTKIALEALTMLRGAMLELASPLPTEPAEASAPAAVVEEGGEVELKKQQQQKKKKVHDPKIAPRDLLGMRDLQTINNAVEFILVLGLVPALAPGIGLPLAARLGPVTKLNPLPHRHFVNSRLLMDCRGFRNGIHSTPISVLSNRRFRSKLPLPFTLTCVPKYDNDTLHFQQATPRSSARRSRKS